MKPWLVIAVLNPTEEEAKRGVVPILAFPLTVVLAKDDKHAAMLVGRQMPEKVAFAGDDDEAPLIVDTSRVEIIVRPF